MKVKDLIKRLEQCDPEAVVVTRVYNGCEHSAHPVLSLIKTSKGDTPKWFDGGSPKLFNLKKGGEAKVDVVEFSQQA